MAFRIRVSSIARNSYRRTPHIFSPNPQNFFSHQPSNPSSTSNSNPLLLKLLHLPNSRIKTTLDHEFPSLPTSLLSLDSLITSLSPSSQKPIVVLEWILEKLLREKVKDHSFFSDLIFLCGKVKNVKLGLHVFSSMEAVGVKPTSLVFNSLINVCLFSNDVVTAYSLFEIMESSERCKPDLCTYDNFISAFSKSGNVDAMLAWYSAKKAAGFGSDLGMFELVLTVCVDAKKFEIADRVFEEMVVSEIIPNGNMIENMLKGLCARKSLSRAEEFVKFVLDNGWQVNETMVEMLIGLYHEQERVEKMEELLES